MWSIPNEDEYWERRREEYERVPKDWKPEPERQILSLDDELDDLEKEYGCKLALSSFSSLPWLQLAI